MDKRTRILKAIEECPGSDDEELSDDVCYKFFTNKSISIVDVIERQEYDNTLPIK